MNTKNEHTPRTLADSSFSVGYPSANVRSTARGLIAPVLYFAGALATAVAAFFYIVGSGA